MDRRLLAAALALPLAACRDEDITDEPILPDNVGASVEECGIEDGAPLAVVEVTNGTGHTARFEVTVAFVRGGRPEDVAGATSEELAPGASGLLRVDAEHDDAAVHDCRIEDVVDLTD